jgi:FkbH-like protein
MGSKLDILINDLDIAPSYLKYLDLSNEIDLLENNQTAIKRLRIAILRNMTIEPLLPVLKGEFYRLGYKSDIYISDFDSIVNDTMNFDSAFYKHEPELIILAQWFELLSYNIAFKYLILSTEEREVEKNRILNNLILILSNIRSKSNAPVILNNFPLQQGIVFGIYDNRTIQSQKKWFKELNDEILAISLKSENVYCLDLEHLFSIVGSENAYSQRSWEVAKNPFTQKIFSVLAKEYLKYLRAIIGKTKKCLVLDCDGTLWGGVLGEDGPACVKIGGSYPGSSFSNFQKYILNLKAKGVILALCSKNNENDVIDFIEKNENVLLKKEHFATYKINWKDKATNILEIAAELNIGYDSIVFVDDNEFECDWVRQKIPEVTVINVNGDPALFQNILSKNGYFDSLTFSEEDKNKTEMYLGEKIRTELKLNSDSYEDYLFSLNLEAEIENVQPNDIARVSQLTLKTNQFNLTTKRYTEDDILRFLRTDDVIIYTLKAKDKISDLGLVATAIVILENDVCKIDTFVMSCRALGRGLENALLIFIIKEMILMNKNFILGSFIPSKKNIQTKDFYFKNSFEKILTSDILEEWQYNLLHNESTNYPKWININTKNK